MWKDAYVLITPTLPFPSLRNFYYHRVTLKTQSETRISFRTCFVLLTRQYASLQKVLIGIGAIRCLQDKKNIWVILLRDTQCIYGSNEPWKLIVITWHPFAHFTDEKENLYTSLESLKPKGDIVVVNSYFILGLFSYILCLGISWGKEYPLLEESDILEKQ